MSCLNAHVLKNFYLYTWDCYFYPQKYQYACSCGNQRKLHQVSVPAFRTKKMISQEWSRIHQSLTRRPLRTACISNKSKHWPRSTPDVLIFNNDQKYSMLFLIDQSNPKWFRPLQILVATYINIRMLCTIMWCEINFSIINIAKLLMSKGLSLRLI